MTNFLSIAISAAHLAALAQIESGNDPLAVGRAGEITAYQVCPMILEEQGFQVADVAEPFAAMRIVQTIWQRRLNHFEITHQRPPTVAEIYLLWHRPARVLRPKSVEKARAVRFENIYAAQVAAQNLKAAKAKKGNF